MIQTKSIIKSLSIGLMLLSLLACASTKPAVPVGTIPKAKVVTPKEEEHGHKVLASLTQQYKLDYSHPRYQSLLDTVERLTTAIAANSQPWHVYLLKDDKVKNAAATQGNHIFMWTGMLNATNNEDELSAVLGHEIAHVLARHTDPDPADETRKAIIEMGALMAGVAVAAATENPNLGQNAGRMTQSLSRELGNAIARYPYSRERELEADHIGLFLMAKAGYEPQAAVHFWQRAQRDPAFSANLAFFSTHPPAGQRLEQLKALIPRIRQQASGSNSKTSSAPAPGTPASRPSSKRFAPAPNNPVLQPLSNGDSFDVSNIRAGAKLSQWKVENSKAIVYLRPDLQARKLGEFRRGALVLGVLENKSWLRITSPESGYINLNDLKATSR